MSEESIELQTEGALSVRNYKPNYTITFHRNGKEIGKLDFNGPKMKFEGDLEDSARVFFDFLAERWPDRIKGSEA